MRLEFKPQAFEDLQFWVQTSPKLAKRLLRLIEETLRDPFDGNRGRVQILTEFTFSPDYRHATQPAY